MSLPLRPGVSPDAITRNSAITRFLNTLDAIGFDAGSTRISVWSVLVVIVVLIGIVLIARLGTRLARVSLARMTRLDATQRLLAEKIVSILLWALAILLGIDMLGIDLTALAVFSGAFGLAIGFGLQKTFGNLIAGIILLMDRSIKPGDVIAVADASGKESFGQVKKIGIRAISITTRDQREYLIPNEILMTSQVENWSYSSRNVRMQVRVGVSYAADLVRAEELMLEAARNCKRVLDVPPPSVWLDSFGDSAVQFVIHCWIQDPEEGVGNVRSEVLKTLWRLFKDNGIELPFPQRDVNLRDSEGLQALLAALGGGRKDPADAG
jgi:small-conductance mechanosensitive channel